MVLQMTQTFLCDICGKPGERYTVNFPEGVLVLDRCERHDRKVTGLREEKGTWNHPTSGRQGFKISSPDEIKQQREARKRKDA